MGWFETAIARVAFGWEVLLFFGPNSVLGLAGFALSLFALRAVSRNWLTRAVGYALIVAGFLGAIVSVAWLSSLSLTAQFGGEVNAEPALNLLASCPFCIALGWMLAAGRKTLVLFLRRFGNEKLNDAIRDLIRRRCRARVRLVTLDDSVFSPAGPRWRGLGWSLMPPALALTVLALIEPLAHGEIVGEGMFGGAAAFILFVLQSVSYVACASFLVLAVTAVRSHYAARRTIRDSASIERALSSIRQLRSLWARPSFSHPWPRW